MISILVLIGHWLIVVLLSLRVITRRWPVGVSSAWLVIVISVPFVGAMLYLLFAEKRLGRQRSARMAASKAALGIWQEGLACLGAHRLDPVSAESAPIERLAESLFGFAVQPAQAIQLLDAAEDMFDSLIADIDAAKSRCNLSFYIWDGEGRARVVIDALVRASARGVRCKALCDAIGSKDFLASEHAQRMREGGIDVRAALPTGLLASLFSRADLRNHRKIVTIDSAIAYSGSQNLVDPRYFKQSAKVGEWVDAMLRLRGPASASLDAVFESDWAIESGKTFAPPLPTTPPETPGCGVQIAPSGPGLKPEAIRQLLLTAIYGARREIIITTPYFVPDDSLLLALRSAAERGVEVILVVPARNDSMLVRYASAATYADLLLAGGRIASFNGGLLHTKSITIDRRTSVFGSVNVDMRRLWLNFEILLLIYDREFSARLYALQHRYIDDSSWIDCDEWQRRPRSRKLLEDILRLLGPLL